ncbi:MAG: hypothetical protein FK732_02030 [Asgard group archaeon]|nr:hypothetical protein [Asgard group archaeon]
MTSEETEEIDFIIYLRNETSQVLVDELIFKAESLGLSVNAIYLDWDTWCLYADAGDFDLAYGGIQIAYPIDDIFNLAMMMTGLEFMVLKHDDAKFSNAVWANYYRIFEAQVTPLEEMGDLIADMLDTFHDAEERLWEKQLIFPLAQFISPYYASTDIVVPNCKAGHIFANEDLRLTYSSIIDYSLFVDYWTALLPYTVWGTHHMYGWASCHDSSLPNCLPA